MISPKLFPAALIATFACLAASGCALLKTDLDADFLRVLREYKKNRPIPGKSELAPEQKSLRNRLEIVKIGKPAVFEEIVTQTRLLESSSMRVRRDALLKLGEFSDDAAQYFEFAFSFFSVSEPSGFDTFLLDPYDPAIFHLERSAFVGAGDAKASEKALALIAPLKIRALFLLAEREMASGWREVVVRAASYGRTGVPTLETLALSPGRPGFTRMKAVEALGLAPLPESQASLFKIARSASAEVPEALKKACLRAASSQAGPLLGRRLREFVNVSQGELRIEAAYLLAARSADRADFTEIAASSSPEIAAAAVLGLARLGAEVGDLAASLPVDESSADRILSFLDGHERIIPLFAAYVTGLCRNEKPSPLAISLLPRTGSPEAAAILTSLIDGRSGAIRTAALEAAASMPPASWNAGLGVSVRKAIVSSEAGDAILAAEAASSVRDETAVQAILGRLSSSPEFGEAAVRALVSISGPEALESVPVEVFVKDIPARAAMIETLVKSGEKGASRFAIELLRLSSPDYVRRGLAIAEAIMGAGDLRYVFDALSLRSPDIVTSALCALGAVDREKAWPVIADYLEANSPDSILAALVAYRSSGMPGEVQREILAMSESQHPAIKAEAVFLLAERGIGREAAARLECVLLEGDPALKVAALEGLARIGGKETAPYIALAMDDASPAVRARAAAAAASLGLKALGAMIGELIRDSDPCVMLESAAALGILGNSGPAESAAAAIASGRAGLPSWLPAWEALAVLGKSDAAAKSAGSSLHGLRRLHALAFIRLKAGDTEGAWKLVGEYAAAAPSLLDVSMSPVVRKLARTPDGRERLKSLLAPGEKGNVFLHLLSGPVTITLASGSHIKGAMTAFEREEVVLGVASGEVRIHRGQIRSIVRTAR